MKLKVTFREYTLPDIDPDTGKQERGEFWDSFTEVFEGETPADILRLAGQWAKEQSAERQMDVQVWEVPVTVTSRGVVSQ